MGGMVGRMSCKGSVGLNEWSVEPGGHTPIHMLCIYIKKIDNSLPASACAFQKFIFGLKALD